MLELAVVISIIGLLSTLAFAVINNARAEARNAKRKADLDAIRNALELYYQDNGRYPTPALITDCDSSLGNIPAYAFGGFMVNCGMPPNSGSWDDTIDGLHQLSPDYVDRLPIDPINNVEHFYSYSICYGDDQQYVLRSVLEQPLSPFFVKYGSIISADFDNDGVVGFSDLVYIGSHCAVAQPLSDHPECYMTDLNSDGVVDINDYNIALSFFPSPCR